MTDWREHLAGRPVIASISGGKDSAAMGLWLLEQGIEHERVFMDTGWEHPATYEYLRGPLTAALGPITEICGRLGMADLCRKKGMFPSRIRRFCTENLKVLPFLRFLRERVDDTGNDYVSAVGLRAAESRARSQLAEWEFNPKMDVEIWRPLIRWTEEDVINTHKRHGLTPNPLYLSGASRVGCWPCIFSSKLEIRDLADHCSERIDFIRTLEAEVGDAAEARAAAKGTSLAELGHNRPSFFQAMGALRTDGGKDGRCAPIDDVVAWARTAHGGRQYEMFAPEREEGCVRWGMCDHGPATGGGQPLRPGDDELEAEEVTS